MASERDRQMAEFAGVVESWGGRNLVRCYSTVGTRGDVDFMIWQVSYELEDIQTDGGRAAGDGAGWVSHHAVLVSLDDEELGVRREVRRTGRGPGHAARAGAGCAHDTCSSTR